MDIAPVGLANRFVDSAAAALRKLLLNSGAVMPRWFVDRVCRRVVAAAHLPITGRWLAENTGLPSTPLKDRQQVYELIARQVSGKKVLYLEFGVYRGYSMRLWSRLIDHPASILHGFDSFEGIPENWGADTPRGGLSVMGAVPQIADPRVRFFKGWFEDTLKSYSLPDHDVLIANLDADVYSSTRTVLNYLRDKLKPGDWLYFDEFTVWDHEFRAFREFVEGSGMRFKAIGAAQACSHIAFKVVE
jgi:hypothetical protein